MADLTDKSVLSVYATVESKLANLAVKDGQLIFVQDKHKICLDFGGKRTIYHQIQELATEGARTSLLAPISGSYYFVLDPGVLWRYQDGWIQITTPPDEVIGLSEVERLMQASAILYSEAQNLTDDRKKLARANIGLDIDYEELLAFDVTEIVISTGDTPTLSQAVLGQSMLGHMVLGPPDPPMLVQAVLGQSKLGDMVLD